MRNVSIVLVLLLPIGLGTALAQQSQPQPQPTMAERNLSTAVQQLMPAVVLYSEDMGRKLAERDARIAELEKLCGEPCKPKEGVK